MVDKEKKWKGVIRVQSHIAMENFIMLWVFLALTNSMTLDKWFPVTCKRHWSIYTITVMRSLQYSVKTIQQFCKN